MDLKSFYPHQSVFELLGTVNDVEYALSGSDSQDFNGNKEHASPLLTRHNPTHQSYSNPLKNFEKRNKSFGCHTLMDLLPSGHKLDEYSRYRMKVLCTFDIELKLIEN